MFKEHDTVILTDTIKGDDNNELLPGDVGCVIHIHGDADAYVVEFAALDGETVDIATVKPEQIRAIAAGDMTHARVTGPARLVS